MIKYDFNFNTTIFRGILLNAHKSINLLMNYIFDEQNTIDYYNMIMLDLPEVLEVKVINLNYFFQYNKYDKNCEHSSLEKECNIEIDVDDERLKEFSSHQQEFIIMNNFESIHEIKDEVVECIL